MTATGPGAIPTGRAVVPPERNPARIAAYAISVVGALTGLGFRRDDLLREIGRLSPGEKNRVEVELPRFRQGIVFGGVYVDLPDQMPPTLAPTSDFTRPSSRS